MQIKLRGGRVNIHIRNAIRFCFAIIVNKVKEIIGRTIIVVCVLIVFLGIHFLPERFLIPNFCGFKNSTALIVVFSTIAGVLASILGIVVAILIVAFEILRKTYASYALKKLLQDKRFRLLLTFFISTILLSISSAPFIEETISVRALNLSYLSIILFFICLLLLYAYSKSIISSIISKKEIDEVIKKIGFAAIDQFDYFRPPVSPTDFASAIQGNPIYILSEIAKRSIRDDDDLTPRVILKQTTNRFKELITQANESLDKSRIRTVIDRFLIITKRSARQAVVQRQEITLKTILDSIEDIHCHCANHHVKHLNLRDLNDSLKELIEQAIDNNLDSVAVKSLGTVERILEEHLAKNVPPEEEIRPRLTRMGEAQKGDRASVDRDKLSQWRGISTEYLFMLSELTENAILNNKREYTVDALHAFTRIALCSIESTNLGDLQKRRIVETCYYTVQNLFIKCVQAKLYPKTRTLFPFSPSDIIDTLSKEKKEFSKVPLFTFCETLIELSKSDSLDDFTLSSLGSIAWVLLDKIHDDFYAEALLCILKTFGLVRNKLELSDRIESKKAYIESFRWIETLQKSIEDKGKRRKVIEMEISSSLKLYKKISDFIEEVERETLTWPSLSKQSI